MYIIWGDNSRRFILAIGNFLELIVESTAHRLQIEFISTKFMNKHLIFVIELVESADEQIIAIIMHLVHVSGCNILNRVEKRDDISKLDDVQQRESELLCLERDSTKI
jgi:hypothetical protein